MIEFDSIEKRMVMKIVYYGPALSGKTTNLLRLHDLLSSKGRGDLMVLDTKDDRTIYFDLLPFFLIAPDGLKIKVKVYTVPGQVCHDATRKAVLSRVDGVAFIADSQTAESANNSESFENLERNLAFVGLNMVKLPLVIQFNKRDLPNIIADDEIERTWRQTGIPVFNASALEGWGILETFRCLIELVYEAADRRFGLENEHGLPKERFVREIVNPVQEVAGERSAAQEPF
ncbi:MAG: GTPase [Deltaproteobacteria bacterium]|nr:MAG: GTPase [Deltaproteobacteria bacterium]